MRIVIPEILEVGANNLSNIGKYVKKSEINKVAVFWGEGIKSILGDAPEKSIKASLEVTSEYETDDISIDSIISKAFEIPKETEAIIGIGGGKVLDVAKYSAFLNNLPFISIPTSTAHDGFASSGCSLIVNGKRTSVQAKMPFGIIVDLATIKNAPEKFIYSGIGDIVSKISSVYDWQFEECAGKTRVNDFAVMIAKKSVNSVVRISFNGIKEDFFIKELVDSLTMSGIAMEIAGSSAPASGSEHLISHALDKISQAPQLHGIQVGLATYIMAKVQEHRAERVTKFLTDTGFFNYVETLGLKRSEFEQAIELAPDIKPNRYTYIHLKENREKAKRLLKEDEILNRILK
jgi:glycerol-1-phosphate dehydrogenase [NAD(P)+]